MKIEDIARLANVSKSAVSLAINGKTGVSDETRKKILSIVEEYNYVPLRTTTARMKKKSTIRFVACKSPELITEQYYNMPFFNQLISYLSSSINSYPYDLVISSFNEHSLLEELDASEKEQQSQGIILLGTNISKEKVLLIQKKFQNLVILDAHYPEVDATFVSINNFLGGYLAADHLIKQGHRKIGYAMGIPRINNFIERKEGFYSKLREAYLEIPNEYLFQLSAMEINEGKELNQMFNNLNDLPTAVFCENDYMAISLIKFLQENDIQVPDQISVIGFDNIPESRAITPELTTLHVDKKEMAVQTLDLFEKQINHTDTNRHVQVNTSLIERGSSRSVF